ncbi:hypothetical protein FA13DRAFT_340654 [Coprinellus micaceus]|uniref:Uncharacterized protein n=1 Tax=Coprinellus micaceus TaxID=71717 RepID=A0A4Y7TC18_COPMI|nr:hypothetical protein FA13DRAFT_340654 [Coprinellus micaceus]
MGRPRRDARSPPAPPSGLHRIPRSHRPQGREVRVRDVVRTAASSPWVGGLVVEGASVPRGAGALVLDRCTHRVFAHSAHRPGRTGTPLRLRHLRAKRVPPEVHSPISPPAVFTLGTRGWCVRRRYGYGYGYGRRYSSGILCFLSYPLSSFFHLHPSFLSFISILPFFHLHPPFLPYLKAPPTTVGKAQISGCVFVRPSPCTWPWSLPFCILGSVWSGSLTASFLSLSLRAYVQYVV